MRDHGVSLSQGIVLGAGMAIGVKTIDWASRNITLDRVGELVSKILAAMAESRSTNPDWFDAYVMNTMRLKGYFSEDARVFWDSLFLTAEEKTRLKTKIFQEMKGSVTFAHLAPLPLGARAVLPSLKAKVCEKCGAQYFYTCRTCIPKRLKRRSVKKHSRRRISSPISESLSARLIGDPVLDASDKKVMRGGREDGSRNKTTEMRLELYDKKRAAGESDEQARRHTASEFAPESKRGIKSLRRSVDAVVEKYRDGGRASLE